MGASRSGGGGGIVTFAPYYQDDAVTLYLGDCREILPTLEADSVDLVLTDPPYGVNKADWDAEFPSDWIEDAKRISSRLLVMPGNMALIEAGLRLGDYRDCIVLYSKNGMTRSPIAFGNYIPVLAIGDWGWKARPNLISFNVRLDENIEHPSPKPREAMRKLIAHYSEPDWVILDPFCGSGTTLRAAKDLGRRAIGIEIEERYAEIAVKRLRQAVLPLGGAA